MQPQQHGTGLRRGTRAGAAGAGQQPGTGEARRGWRRRRTHGR